MKVKKEDKNRNSEGISMNLVKKLFLEMKIIKDNFRLTMIVISLLAVYFLVIGVFMVMENSKLFEFEHRIDDRCLNGSC